MFLGDVDLGSGLSFLHALLEFFHAAGCIHELLLACIKRMTGRTNFHMELFASASCGKSIAAGANDFGAGEIGWMNSFFHVSREIITGGGQLDKTSSFAFPSSYCYNPLTYY